MNVSLYQAAAAMNATARWQEAISENLSAGQVPGFRKQHVSFSAVQAGLTSGISAIRHSIPTASTATNFVSGELRASGGQLDFAIEGKAFFEVQLPDGSKAYTRDGEFHLNAQGQLITKLGHVVLSDAGPVQIDPNNPAPLTISANGSLSQGEETKGRLQLVEFGRPDLLTSIGGGYFYADQPGALPANAVASSVRQGYLEAPNLSPTTEMANLITSMRMFEANQRVLQNHDERMGRIITELGQPA